MKDKIIKNLKVILLTFILTILFFTLIPKVFGYKFVYVTEIKYDFDAISAWGTILSAFIPLILVIASHIITKRVDESNERTQREVQESNAITADYVKSMIDDAIKSNPAVIELTEEERHQKLKEKVNKYVSLQGFSNTKRVAEHLDISEEEAFKILEELLKVDGSISAGGQVDINNLENIVWLKRSK